MSLLTACRVRVNPIRRAATVAARARRVSGAAVARVTNVCARAHASTLAQSAAANATAAQSAVLSAGASASATAAGGCPFGAAAAAVRRAFTTTTAPKAAPTAAASASGKVKASGHPAFVNPYSGAPALSEAEIAVIRQTVPVLAAHGLTLTRLFYQRMFGANPALKNIFNSANQATDMQPKALADALYAYATNIANPSALAAAIGLMAHKHASLSVLPAMYPIVGTNLLATLGELLKGAGYDETTIAAVLSAWAKAYGVLANVLITEEEKLYKAAESVAGGWRGWRQFTVAKRVDEAQGITSFYLTPTDGAGVPAYLPGQFTTVKVALPATRTEAAIEQPRQYSLSQPGDGQHFRITVKREDARPATCPVTGAGGSAAAAKASASGCPAGRVSNFLHTELRVGSTVELAPPFGSFVLPATTSSSAATPVVLIGGGVGITPLAAMAEAAAATGRPVHFLYACDSGKRHALKSWLSALKHKQQQKTAAARAQSFVSRVWYRYPEAGDVKGKDYDAVGLMDLSVASHPQQLLPPVTAGAEYYVCGPTPFMNAQLQALAARGVPSDKLHAEVFGTGMISGATP